LIASLSHINYIKIYDISKNANDNIYEDSDEYSDSSSGWREEEIIKLNQNEEDEKKKGKSEIISDDSFSEKEGKVEEKDIELNHDAQLEALLADGDFGDILENIKINKIKNNKNKNQNKKIKQNKYIEESEEELREEKENDFNENEELNESENDNEDYSEENDNSESCDYSEDKKKEKKKKNKKIDKLLKFKVIGKKRNSDWIIEKEKRKDFFNNL